MYLHNYFLCFQCAARAMASFYTTIISVLFQQFDPQPRTFLYHFKPVFLSKVINEGQQLFKQMISNGYRSVSKAAERCPETLRFDPYNTTNVLLQFQANQPTTCDPVVVIPKAVQKMRLSFEIHLSLVNGWICRGIEAHTCFPRSPSVYPYRWRSGNEITQGLARNDTRSRRLQ